MANIFHLRQKRDEASGAKQATEAVRIVLDELPEHIRTLPEIVGLRCGLTEGMLKMLEREQEAQREMQEVADDVRAGLRSSIA